MEITVTHRPRLAWLLMNMLKAYMWSWFQAPTLLATCRLHQPLPMWSVLVVSQAQSADNCVGQGGNPQPTLFFYPTYEFLTFSGAVVGIVDWVSFRVRQNITESCVTFADIGGGSLGAVSIDGIRGNGYTPCNHAGGAGGGLGGAKGGCSTIPGQTARDGCSHGGNGAGPAGNTLNRIFIFSGGVGGDFGGFAGLPGEYVAGGDVAAYFTSVVYMGSGGHVKIISVYI